MKTFTEIGSTTPVDLEICTESSGLVGNRPVPTLYLLGTYMARKLIEIINGKV